MLMAVSMALRPILEKGFFQNLGTLYPIGHHHVLILSKTLCGGLHFL